MIRMLKILENKFQKITTKIKEVMAILKYIIYI